MRTKREGWTLPGMIALFGAGSDAEKVYQDLGEELAGGFCVISGVPERGSAESNRKGLKAAMAGDRVVDSATVGLFTLNPGDHVTFDPWDEEFGLEYSPGQSSREDGEQPMVSVKGDFPGLADGGVETADRVVARIPVTAEERESIAAGLREGKTAVWAKVERSEIESVRSIMQQAGPDSLMETNG